MENQIGTGGTGSTGSTGSTGAAGGEANNQLSQAFDKAMEKAAKTLEITTEKGAELYALKQSVR